MQRRVGQIIDRWERRRAVRHVQRELQTVSGGVRKDYLEALRRAA